jgi:hypothetical protein
MLSKSEMKVQMMTENVECRLMVLGRREDIRPTMGSLLHVISLDTKKCLDVEVCQTSAISAKSGKKGLMIQVTVHGKHHTSARSLMKEVLVAWRQLVLFGFLNGH